MLKRLILSFVFLLIAATLLVGYVVYSWMNGPNLMLDAGVYYFHIPSQSNYQQVLNQLEKEKILKNAKSFDWIARKKNLHNTLKPGRYKLTDGMSNIDFIHLLRSGRQEPLNLCISNVHTKPQLAKLVSDVLELDSLSLVLLLNDDSVARHYGFSLDNFTTMIIPNTYQFYWNTDASGFLDRMQKEHEKFWNPNRKLKANELGLTASEVYVLASIVQKETSKVDEMPKVAGVYLNRIKTGMRLQADPTLIFALNDYSIQRVLKRDMDFDSPYNTYKYEGLPPGAITFAEVYCIDAVLNRNKHNYLYFCASDDFSGYHRFASSYNQHKMNARAYQKALNKREILR